MKSLATLLPREIGNQPPSLGAFQKSPPEHTQVWLKRACYK